MQLRRNLLMQQTESTLDTSPKILAEGKRWSRGGFIDGNDTYATVIYRYEAVSTGRQLRYSGTYGELNVFTDDTYVDYWSYRNDDTRNVLNANTNGVAFTLTGGQIEAGKSYAYIPDTGQILFAGKNTPYYGYLNINDMPT